MVLSVPWQDQNGTRQNKGNLPRDKSMQVSKWMVLGHQNDSPLLKIQIPPEEEILTEVLAKLLATWMRESGLYWKLLLKISFSWRGSKESDLQLGLVVHRNIRQFRWAGVKVLLKHIQIFSMLEIWFLVTFIMFERLRNRNHLEFELLKTSSSSKIWQNSHLWMLRQLHQKLSKILWKIAGIICLESLIIIVKRLSKSLTSIKLMEVQLRRVYQFSKTSIRGNYSLWVESKSEQFQWWISKRQGTIIIHFLQEVWTILSILKPTNKSHLIIVVHHISSIAPHNRSCQQKGK